MHGLGRSRLAMRPLVTSLRREGFRVWNLGYSAFTTRRTLREVYAKVAQQLEYAYEDGPGVHFVTHSMGGILARLYLSEHRERASGSRLVQLAPPNQGAVIAEVLRHAPLVGWFMGRPLLELGKTATGEPRHGIPRLEAVDVGVIAGGRGDPRGYDAWFPDDSDGIVRVRETYLPEAKDWVLVPAVHTFIMRRPDVRRYALHFLREGVFPEEALRLKRVARGIEAVSRP